MPKENTSYNVNMETEQEIHGEILTLLRGYSSYELAKKHGFVGTEEEYLASLVGEKGETGNGIENVVLNDNYTITINYTNGDSYTIPTPIRGEKGETGNGIESATLNPDYTLTFNFTNGGSYTTPSIRGLQGERGLKGDQGIQGETGISISRVKLNPDYTLTIYFTDETSHTTSSIRGIQGEKGEEGRGIEYVTVNADYSLTFKYTDGNTYNTPVLRGIQGVQGEKGDTGNGISSAVLNQDYTLTLNFTDGSSFTTSSIRGQTGERGEQGIQGEPGKGIVKTELNPDYTLTISFSDGSYYTTPSIRGERGIQGEKGKDGADGVGISSVIMNQDYTLTINFDDGTQYTTEPIRGEKGEKGDSGDSPTITTTKSGKRTTIYADDSPIGTVDDGDDGTTPSITASKSGSITTISVNGNPVAEINDGIPGQDGVSPSATVTQTVNGATITITDKTGTTTATVTNGQDGQDGDDGFSPTATVSKSGSIATITITDKNGTTTAEVHDGQGGTGTIDPTPTEGSTNAVSSGGVYDELTDVKSNLTQTENDIKQEIIDGYVAISTGTTPTVPSALDFIVARITPKSGVTSARGTAYMKINGGAGVNYYPLCSATDAFITDNVKEIRSQIESVYFVLFCYNKSDSSYAGAIYKEYTFKTAEQLNSDNSLFPYQRVDMDTIRTMFPDYDFKLEITDISVNTSTLPTTSDIVSWVYYYVPTASASRQLVLTVNGGSPDSSGNVTVDLDNTWTEEFQETSENYLAGKFNVGTGNAGSGSETVTAEGANHTVLGIRMNSATYIGADYDYIKTTQTGLYFYVQAWEEGTYKGFYHEPTHVFATVAVSPNRGPTVYQNLDIKYIHDNFPTYDLRLSIVDITTAERIPLTDAEYITYGYSKTVKSIIADQFARMQVIEGNVEELQDKHAINIPSHFETQLATKIETIKANMEAVGRNGQTFIFITDLHWPNNRKYSPALIRRILDATNVTEVICGGDLINEGTYELSEGIMMNCINSFKSLGITFPVCFGNHDSNWNDAYDQREHPERHFSEANVYGMMEAPYVARKRTYFSTGFNYYIDIDETNTRFIFIDTGEDRTVGSDEGVLYRDYNNLADVLNASGDRNIIIIAHSVTTDSIGSRLCRVSNKYNARETYNPSYCDVDFTNAQGHIYGIIAGHCHYGTAVNVDGLIPYITTDTDSQNTHSEAGSASGTVNEQAFDVVTVDYSTGTFHIVGIGRCPDRTIYATSS